MDKKPDLTGSGDVAVDKSDSGIGIKPIYGFEGIPSFPPKWTYPPRPVVSPVQYLVACKKELTGQEEVVDDTPHGQITKRSLDFVKLTASERGDIPAELGVVNFRKQRKRMAA